MYWVNTSHRQQRNDSLVLPRQYFYTVYHKVIVILKKKRDISIVQQVPCSSKRAVSQRVLYGDCQLNVERS